VGAERPPSQAVRLARSAKVSSGGQVDTTSWELGEDF